MANLNANACAVILAGRRGALPPAGERERLEALLDARLAASITPSASVGGVHSARTLKGKGRGLALAVGLGAIGGAALLWPTPKHVDSRVLQSKATLLSLPAAGVAPPSTADSAGSSLPAPALLPSAAKRLEPQAPAPSADRLAEEVALLSRATRLLRAGRSAEALSVLDEHQRKFPKGALEIERTAVRAQALCALERVSEGRAALALLAPDSPAAGRAKQVCDRAASTDAR